MNVVGVMLMVAGAAATVGWAVVAWRTEVQLAGIDSLRSGPSTGSVGSPDFLDRVVALVQISFLLMSSLLVLGFGLGLCVAATHLRRDEPLPDRPDAEPVEVELQRTDAD